MREIAQQLLAYEAAAADDRSETASPPVGRVLDALRSPLGTLVGVQGGRVLFARALALARAKIPSLSALTVQPDGSFSGLGELNSGDVSEAGVVLTAQLLELLATFIGKELVLRILRGVWPDLFVPGARGNGKKNNDWTR